MFYEKESNGENQLPTPYDFDTFLEEKVGSIVVNMYTNTIASVLFYYIVIYYSNPRDVYLLYASIMYNRHQNWWYHKHLLNMRLEYITHRMLKISITVINKN